MEPEGDGPRTVMDAGAGAVAEVPDDEASDANDASATVFTPSMAQVTPATASRQRANRPSSAFEPTAIVMDETLDGATTGVFEAVQPPLVDGTVLAGRYHLLGLVGQGGMGTVYAARDTDLDEEVALKVLQRELARDDAYQRRLKAEVRLARRVSHPNVCRVHDLGVDGDNVFVTMELVRGRTLRHLLAEMHAARTPPFELAQIVDIVVQIAAALSAAHRAGVIHRDVKPDNVILTEGRTVLTDFGVASLVAELGPRLIAGTPAYLAPEVVRHEPFDHRVDIYAVAALAYELLTGRTPHAAKTMDAASRIARDRPPYPELPEAMRPHDVRRALDRVLARGLASDPIMRTPTIERFAEGFAAAARETTPGATIAMPARSAHETVPPSQITTPASTRRPEVRVATALVWKPADPKSIEAAERIIVDAGGSLLEVTASEVSALFGAPRSLGDDADRAARAALAVVERHGGRAGLDTTRVLLRPGVAEIASPDVANAASDLAGAAAPAEVIASSVTARQLAPRFDLAATSGGLRRVAGVRIASAPGIETYRACELAEIDNHLERAFRERVPVFVEVRGGSGSGKTRLREALVGHVSARREVEWLVAVTSPVGAPAPLAIVQSASGAWFDAATGAGTISDPAHRLTAARRWLESRASWRPVVLVVEDVQWADATSRALLDHLRTSLDSVPVAIVAFERVDDGAGAAAARPKRDGTSVVTLGPIDAISAARLARSIARDANDSAIAALVARAAGNPFFVEELARDLAERGGPAPSLPTSVEAVVGARLDHLPERLAAVLAAAAVIGRSFWRGAVARLSGITGAELDAALVDLERGGLIAATAPATVDDERYQFAQALVYEVVLGRIPARDRRQRHADVARWLDERAANTAALRLDERSSARDPRSIDLELVLAIAHHREQAGDADAAIAAYRRAGQRCLAVFAYGEAASAMRRAASLAGTAIDAALQEDLGDALGHVEGPGAAEPAYHDALAALPAGTTTQRVRLIAKLANAASRRGDHATAITRYRQGLSLLDQLPKDDGDPRIAAQLHGGLGWTLGYQLARVDEGHPYCERAVAMLEGTPYRRELAGALSKLGGTYMRACRFADQLRCNQRNLDIGRELGDLDMQLTANINLGVVHGLLGSIGDAIAATEAARALAARMGAVATAGLVASNLGGLLLEQRRLDEAERMLEEAHALIERTGKRYVLCETHAFSARLAAARGDLVGAKEHAEQSRDLANALDNRLDAAVAVRLLAQIAARDGDHGLARRLIDEALAAVIVVDAFEAARTRAARVRVLRAAGDAGADAAAEASREELERLGARREVAVLEDVKEVR